MPKLKIQTKSTDFLNIKKKIKKILQFGVMDGIDHCNFLECTLSIQFSRILIEKKLFRIKLYIFRVSKLLELKTTLFLSSGTFFMILVPNYLHNYLIFLLILPSPFPISSQISHFHLQTNNFCSKLA